MIRPLRVLLIEDCEDDAAQLLRELERGGYAPVCLRIETPAAMQRALQNGPWDVVLVEWDLPQFGALFALEMLKSQGLDLPFIIVSRTISEEAAVDAIKAGAHDFIPKQHLRRLVLPIERELREADVRRAKRAAEMALVASEERLQLVSRATNDAVRDWDLSTNAIWWNQGFFTLFGYKPDELEPDVESWYSRLHPEERDNVMWSCYAAINGGGQTWSEQYRFLREDGTYADVMERAYIVRNVSGRALRLIGAITDLTSIRKAEDKLRWTEMQLQQAQKMETIGRLAGGVAHDFNNLLTVIMGYSDLVINNLPAGSPALESVQEIRTASERATWLTRQLLAFSRPQVISPQIMDLNALIANLEKMLHRLIGEDVVLKTELESALAPVKADPGQIEQIIMTLAVNARDDMPSGGRLMIETHMVLLDESYPKEGPEVPPGRYVQLMVSNTGIGMDSEMQKHIFEPFFMTKVASMGMGCGLSTLYDVVKQCDGFIWVYREPGHGTTFKIYLPAVKEDVSVTKDEAISVQQRISMESILLVEDAAPLRALTKKVLELNGYTVWVAENSDEAMTVANAHGWAIQLLLTDVIMPGGSGAVVAARLKERCPGLKVLYMSGYTGTAMAGQGILESGSTLLSKPYSPDQLLQKVREVLDAPMQKSG